MASPTYIHAIETAVPATQLPQDEVRRLLYGTTERSRLAQRLTDTVFAASGVETRHLFLAQVDQDNRHGAEVFAPGSSAVPVDLGAQRTGRNGVAAPCGRRRERGPCERGLRRQRRDARDHRLVHRLLGARNRHPISARPGPTASQPAAFTLASWGAAPRSPHSRPRALSRRRSPNAVILVVCVEICSLHLKVGEGVDEIVASSLFADGCAAMIVSARARAQRRRGA